MWAWHWSVFLISVLPCILLVAFCLRAWNIPYLAKYGPKADPRAILGGAALALVITVSVGFFI